MTAYQKTTRATQATEIQNIYPSKACGNAIARAYPPLMLIYTNGPKPTSIVLLSAALQLPHCRHSCKTQQLWGEIVGLRDFSATLTCPLRIHEPCYIQTMNRDLTEIFKSLRPLFSEHSDTCVVLSDGPIRYYLGTHEVREKDGYRTGFGGVEIKKNYVSAHLMPIYSLVARSATRLILVTAYSLEDAINAAQVQR